jgi:broad specificity phosphatase PhoE
MSVDVNKSVLLIRHGESTFNAAYRETGVDPLHLDARLTETGLAQVADARERLRHTPIDLVVVSPLTRALQTALGIFADHPSRPTLLVEALHREHGFSSCDVGRAPARSLPASQAWYRHIILHDGACIDLQPGPFLQLWQI